MTTLNPLLVKTLPQDVIREHIMPFTYRPQPKSLLEDIESYHTGMTEIEDHYYTEFNEYFLYYDIVTFCNSHTFIENNYEIVYKHIIQRHICYKHQRKMQRSIYLLLSYYYRNDTKRYIRFLWGLLTPYERTQFITQYIDIDTDIAL